MIPQINTHFNYFPYKAKWVGASIVLSQNQCHHISVITDKTTHRHDIITIEHIISHFQASINEDEKRKQVSTIFDPCSPPPPPHTRPRSKFIFPHASAAREGNTTKILGFSLPLLVIQPPWDSQWQMGESQALQRKVQSLNPLDPKSAVECLRI